MKNIFVLLSLIFLTGCWTTERGEKVGQIVSVSHAGAFTKTWEATLIRGGFDNGSGTLGEKFSFTIENEFLLKQLQQYLTNRKNVKITYHKEGFYKPWRCESDGFFIDNIEE